MNIDIPISDSIKNKIFTIRGVQVMLDSDLAELYGVEIRVLNQAVKRNIERFPEDFMFQLNKEEFDSLRSQFVTLKKGRGEHRKYLPYAFTEQGVAMLSSVLKSKKAIEVNIKIMRAFVAMRKFLSANAQVFQRLDRTEMKLLEHDKNFEKLFKALEHHKPKQGIFFDGQIFDAHKFVSSLIRKAKKSIILIDNFIDESVLILFTKRNKGVSVVIYTKNISKQLELDLKKFNLQYDTIEIKEFSKSHDRFLIIDDKELYHIGASLKDLGKKWFAFTKIDFGLKEILMKIEENGK